MNLLKLKRNYANALLDVCTQAGNTHSIADEVSLFLRTLDENPQLKRVMHNPVIKPEQKWNILKEIFGNTISRRFQDFLELIVMNNRADLLGEVLLLFLKLKDDREGIAKVQLSVQFIPDADQTERIRGNIEKLINRKVILDIKVDNTILGGFVARFEDIIIDASLHHQLEKLKKLFLKTSINLN